MTDERDREVTALVVARRELRSANDLFAHAGPASDFTYRVFDAQRVEGANFHQSLFTGSVIRSSTFTTVDFSRSDLDGFKAERCTFTNCHFIGCDIRSSAFDECSFHQCKFDEALITDCTFAACKFTDTSLERTVISDNSFEGVVLERCGLHRSSFVQNRIVRSHLADITMGDCTFLYILMVDCSFDRCAINAESVGMIYGLNLEDLKLFDFIYLGKKLPVPDREHFLQRFLFEYASRGWNLGVCMMRLNFKLSAPLFAISQYLKAVESEFERGLIVKREELQFFAQVMTELHAREELPLLASTAALETVLRAYRGLSGSASEIARSGRSLREFGNAASILMQEEIARIEAAGITAADLRDKRLVSLSLVFEEQPAVSIPSILEAIASNTVLQRTAEPKLLSVRNGSYVEDWATPISIMLMFNVFLIALNGYASRLQELKARLMFLRRPVPPKAYLELASRPAADIAPVLAAALQKLLPLADRQRLLDSPSLRGLTLDNVKSIDVYPVRKSRSTGTKRPERAKKPRKRRAK